MFMINIPRRKIYETMLEFEDGLIEMQILLMNEKNFDKFYKDFFEFAYPKIKDSYIEIKALLIMFLENRKYPQGDAFSKDLKKMKGDEKLVNELIANNKNFKKDFVSVCKEIDNIFDSLKELKNIEEGKNVFNKLDAFNSEIPNILTIRRDNLKE